MIIIVQKKWTNQCYLMLLFCLYKAFQGCFFYHLSGHSVKGNTKCIMNSTATLEGIPFYHVHGIASLPVSICLGYEHYISTILAINNTLNDKKEQKSIGIRISKILNGAEKPDGVWAEKFFTSNMAIIGLGLSECESDLWWLLTQRAYLYYTNQYDFRKLMKNQIIFYDTLDERKKTDPKKEYDRVKDNEAKERLYRLMGNEHITAVAYKIGVDCGSYEEAYKMAFDDMKKRF